MKFFLSRMSPRRSTSGRTNRDGKKFGTDYGGEWSVVVKFLLADRASEVGEVRIYKVNS
jgi:hypothetical protein